MKQIQSCANIVIDGANIIHCDYDIEMKDQDGNRLIQIRPERLLQAIEYCENLGWYTVAVLKKGTYIWGKSNEELPTVGEMSIIDELISQGKVELINSQDEDIYFIQYALKNNSVLITKDTFKDKVKNGKTIKRERSLYPDLDWEKIDSSTLGYDFIKGQILVPGLPEYLESQEKKSDTVSHDEVNELKREISDMKKQIRHINNELIRLNANNKGDNFVTNSREIFQAVVSNRLGGGEIVEFTQFHREIGAAILGLDLNVYPQKWPKDWAKSLRVKLGLNPEAKFTSEFLSISRKKLCVVADKSIKGRQNLFLC
ncbi:hypothetical protein N9M06_00070 [Candidatus Poseidoniales archaeon]|nr:hypothetical protein [Candidatus Poseidoniales archaeon]